MKKKCVLFLKAFSLETDILVQTLYRWFYGKERKILKRNPYLTENRFSWNETICAVVNNNYLRHMCSKGFLDSSFN